MQTVRDNFVFSYTIYGRSKHSKLHNHLSDCKKILAWATAVAFMLTTGGEQANTLVSIPLLQLMFLEMNFSWKLTALRDDQPL